MSGAADITELLQHSTWMRRLAMSLVRDDAAADDLVQETWIAALEHPPRAGRTARPWLGEVLRNAVRARFRSDVRRVRREEASVDQDLAAPAADQLVIGVQVQRALAEEVLALEEPYLSTVLLRFYEGQSAAEIAVRQGVPAGTVRWRLKEGLDQLRVRLDRKHAGERGAWLRALAPVAAGKLVPASIGQGLVSPALIGAMTMKVGAVLIFIAGVAVALVALWHRAGARPPAVESSLARPTGGQAAAGASPATAAAPIAEPSTGPTGQPAPRPAQRLARLDASARLDLLRRIQSAHPGTPPGTVPSQDAPELDKEYIRAQIKGLLPLLNECYSNALRQDAALNGKLVVHFSIVGDPSVGGLVGESRIVDDKSTIADKEMRECVQETMYAAKFPPPKDSGEVRVEYPFLFKSSDDDEH